MSLQYPKGVDLHQVTPYSHWHVEGLLTAQAMERTVGPSLSLCPPNLCYKYPSRQKKSPLSPKTLSDWLVWHCGANLPTATEEKAGWKVAGTWAEQGPPAAGTHQCEATKQGEAGKVCKANRVWTRAGEYHMCMPHYPTSTRKKKQGELSRRYTPENSPMRHVQRSTEIQGKKEVKKDSSVTKTNKIKILLKKN